MLSLLDPSVVGLPHPFDNRVGRVKSSPLLGVCIGATVTKPFPPRGAPIIDIGLGGIPFGLNNPYQPWADVVKGVPDILPDASMGAGGKGRQGAPPLKASTTPLLSE